MWTRDLDAITPPSSSRPPDRDGAPWPKPPAPAPAKPATFWLDEDGTWSVTQANARNP
jgi:hypothetical protein